MAVQRCARQLTSMRAASSIGERAKLLWNSGNAFCTLMPLSSLVPKSSPLTAFVGCLQAWRNRQQYASPCTSIDAVLGMAGRLGPRPESRQRSWSGFGSARVRAEFVLFSPSGIPVSFY